APAPEIIGACGVQGSELHLVRKLVGLEGGFDGFAAAVLENELCLALLQLRLPEVRGDGVRLVLAEQDHDGVGLTPEGYAIARLPAGTQQSVRRSQPYQVRLLSHGLPLLAANLTPDPLSLWGEGAPRWWAFRSLADILLW